MSKTGDMSKTGKICPFFSAVIQGQKAPRVEPEIGMVIVSDSDIEAYRQKCGESCALYSDKLQECVFGTIANRLGDIAEQFADSAAIPW